MFIEESITMKIAIIDSQHIFREGLQRLIEVEEDIEIVASIESFSDFTEEIIQEIDLFLVDIGIVNEERALINRLVIKKDASKKVVALSSETGQADVRKAVLAGCHGFLLKEMSYPKFIEAVRVIVEQGNFIHPQVLHHIVDEYRKLSRGNNNLSKQFHLNANNSRVCTNRENEILQLLVNGNDNSNIAKELSISEKTVKNHLTNIFRKLNVKDRTQAAVLAIRNDWVEL